MSKRYESWMRNAEMIGVIGVPLLLLIAYVVSRALGY
jgi:hypothetical protein